MTFPGRSGNLLKVVRRISKYYKGSGHSLNYTTEGGWLHLEASALVEDAIAAKERGFGGSKLKIGRRPHEDVARIAAVRDAVGYDFEILTDANQRLQLTRRFVAPIVRAVGEYIPQLEPITTESMKIEDGRAVPIDKPGIGISWDLKAIEQMAVVSGCVRGDQ